MNFLQALKDRILILDGAMGTMLQQGISEEDTMKAYIEAGADIITTNSFDLPDPGNGPEAVQKAREAAAMARKIADAAGRDVYVAGSAGPSNKSLTLAQNITDPYSKKYDFDDFVRAYTYHFQGLVEGGADVILMETFFDPLNAKAAIKALDNLGLELPLIISATVSDKSGRTLTGHTLEAFYRAVEHAPNLCAFGINCALGARQMSPLVRDIASFCHHAVSFHPNAGLPDEEGSYKDSPEIMAEVAEALGRESCLNIAGGCCGTTPDHIRAIKKALSGMVPRKPHNDRLLTVSGLEAYTIDTFTNIGERTNVAGSRKFARLIAEGDFARALEIASAQIHGGASLIDINMDDPMLDSTERMCTFLRIISQEPDIASAAIMIDSSHWETIVGALKCVPGKSIVNSISLKDGEDAFLEHARTIHSYGAAMVVMAFDEEGQALDFKRKTEICKRSFDLLTGKAGIPAHDIIFDCNILTIGTGVKEHNRFGIDFIDAVGWIKKNLDGALTSGGVSNLSFAFRGNNTVREAMHSVFLYHCINAGLDMAIVNPQMLSIYDDLDPELRDAVEDVLFDRDDEAGARLLGIAERFIGDRQTGNQKETACSCSKCSNPMERLTEAVICGDTGNLESDALEAMKVLGAAVKVIEGPLMQGMEEVGKRFADGRMFLPQVVKSAKVMHDSVDILKKWFKEDISAGTRPRYLIATVQGDVHDIGKNIVATVLSCSGFDVIDLGVMVPVNQIIDTAIEKCADIIGVSGLITPSLKRMEELCSEMSARKLDIPLFVGGAAASALHTAVKLAPLYDKVFYSSDASSGAVLAKHCMDRRQEFIQEQHSAQEQQRAAHKGYGLTVHPTTPAASSGFLQGHPLKAVPLSSLSWDDLKEFFEWRMFDAICGLPACGCVKEDFRQKVLPLLKDKGTNVTVCAEFHDCWKEGDTLVTEDFRFPMLRQELSLADFFSDDSSNKSQLGIFAIKVNHLAEGPDELSEHAALATLAEAASLYMSAEWKKQLPPGYRLIMPAIGYPCCPDHSLKKDLLDILPKETGINLTDSCAMIPEASICGFVIAHTDAKYFNINRISPEIIARYAAARHFTEEERELFLSTFS